MPIPLRFGPCRHYLARWSQTERLISDSESVGGLSPRARGHMAGMRIRTAVAGVFVASMLLAVGASAAEPPPGAVMSDSLDYVGRVADTGTVIEGKFDKVHGRD